MQLANGANARHLTMLCRPNELADAVPDKVATLYAALFIATILSLKLIQIAPWLEQQAYAIEEMPAI